MKGPWRIVALEHSMHDVKQTHTEEGRPSRAHQLLLALLPTGTVLFMLGFFEALGREHLLCASMASSAFLVYRDPEHETNAARALVMSQMTAASIGWVMWSLLGPGFASASTATAATILVMILFNAVHPPAVSTALAFAMRTDGNSNIALFGLAVAMTAVLLLLKHAVLWFLSLRH
jgi:CBS-domain-containing membrane protein